MTKKNAFYKAECLELVPEEPEFEYGETIEVSDDGKKREKRIFLIKIPGKTKRSYICVGSLDAEDFTVGGHFSWYEYEYARKIKSKLTREEIAKHFGVTEDFILID